MAYRVDNGLNSLSWLQRQKLLLQSAIAAKAFLVPAISKKKSHQLKFHEKKESQKIRWKKSTNLMQVLLDESLSGFDQIWVLFLTHRRQQLYNDKCCHVTVTSI